MQDTDRCEKDVIHELQTVNTDRHIFIFIFLDIVRNKITVGYVSSMFVLGCNC